MNIWRWFQSAVQELEESGQTQLAERFSGLPNAAIENHVNIVDSSVPELLAAARSMQNPWLETFVRHWHCQSLHIRSEARANLRESVAALEFSHREDVKDCPQSICTVQDVCRGFEGVDGPGYAAQRIAVAEETLARIDPTWPCYECISAEHASALRDSDRADEALALLTKRHAAIQAAGSHLSVDDHDTFAGHQISAGKYEEAIATLDMVESRNWGLDGERYRIERCFTRASALLHLGRFDEAIAVLPSAQSADEKGLEVVWSENVHGLIKAGAMPNTWQLTSHLFNFGQRLADRGAAWNGYSVASYACELATQRGSKRSAAAALAVMKQAQAELRTPDRVNAEVEAYEAAINALPDRSELPVPASELLAWLQSQEDGTDLEEALDYTVIALEERPDDVDLTQLRASLLMQSGRGKDAIAVMFAQVEQDPSSIDVGFALMAMAISRKDNQALDRLFALMNPVSSTNGSWIRANQTFMNDKFAEVGAHCAVVLEAKPEGQNVRRLWAEASRNTKDFTTELRMRTELIEILEAEEDDERDPNEIVNQKWRSLIPATILGEWDVVHRIGRDFGMDIDNDSGPIDELWHYMRVRFPGTDDEGSEDCMAIRTGPVTARIVQVSMPWEGQHYGAEIVFEPSPIDSGDSGDSVNTDAASSDEPSDENGDESSDENGTVMTFPWVHTMVESDVEVEMIDSAHPGEDALDALRDACGAVGAVFQVKSGPHYTFAPANYDDNDDDDEGDDDSDSGDGGDSDAGDEVRPPGMFGVIAIREGADRDQVIEVVRAHTASWPQPVECGFLSE